MYRLYAEYDKVAVRTARRYRDLQKAIEVAKTINAKVVYVRQLLASGKELLVDVVQSGHSASLAQSNPVDSVSGNPVALAQGNSIRLH